MAVRDETAPTARRRGQHLVNILLMFFVVCTASAVASGLRRRSPLDGAGDLALLWRQRRTPSTVPEGPPIKPEHFRSVAELNQYLADLNEYYTVLGRPRRVPPNSSS